MTSDNDLKSAMKSAEQWLAETSTFSHDVCCLCPQCKGGFERFITVEQVKALQLGALKEGMRRAADLKPNMVQEKCYGETESAWGQGYNAGTAEHCSRILSAAEAMTETDL